MVAPLHARVNGAGPTGILAALALAHAGWTVTLVDPLPRDRLIQRRRAYAFTHSSRQLLQQLGLWAELQDHLIPFRRLHLVDAALERTVDLSPADLAAAVRGSDASIGWIGAHTPVMTMLLERARQDPSIALNLAETGSLQDGADLVVAADGPDSPTRRSLAIGTWGWAYGQSCLTVQVAMRGSAAETAWELLRPEGPFAVLPLGKRTFQLVWSASRNRARRLEGLNDAAFLDALAGVLPDQLQPDALLDEPRAFPVSLALARRLHRGRTVLVGESAHHCHPVGGQGLNLCWRDVEVLHRLACRAAGGRLAPRRIAAAYALRRWPDVLFTLASTDLLVRVFSNRHRPLLALRSLAFTVLSRWPFSRRWILGLMTLGLPSARPQGRRRPPESRHGDQLLPPATTLSRDPALPAPPDGPR